MERYYKKRKYRITRQISLTTLLIFTILFNILVIDIVILSIGSSVYKENFIETYIEIAEDTGQKIGEQIDWDKAEKWLDEKNENDPDWKSTAEVVSSGKYFREMNYLIAGVFKEDGFYCIFDTEEDSEERWHLGYVYSKEQFYEENKYITDIDKQWEMFQNGEKVSYSLESSDGYLASPAILSIYIPFTDSTGKVKGYVVPSYDYQSIVDIQSQYIKDNLLVTAVVSLIVFLIAFYFTKFVVINKMIYITKKARKFIEDRTEYSFSDRRNTYNEVVILEEVLETLYVKIDDWIEKINFERNRASIDCLTKLLNRSSFSDEIGGILETSDKSLSCAYIMLDIDEFKLVNDKFGHKVGDKTLVAVADSMKKNFGKDASVRGVISRIGGDEFTAFLIGDGLSKDTLIEKIKQFMRDFAKYKLPDDGGVTLSIGAVLTDINFEGEKLTIDKFKDRLYQNADRALYEVKESGRNNFLIY